MELPNTHAHTYGDIHTHTHTTRKKGEKVERGEKGKKRRKKNPKKRGGVWFSSRLYYPFGKGPGQHIIWCLKNKKCENKRNGQERQDKKKRERTKRKEQKKEGTKEGLREEGKENKIKERGRGMGLGGLRCVGTEEGRTSY